ncbi:flavin monoamine oxidase family protein [Litorimonas haliclonae]|uniref:flavin monoamine oxidase family protein n=1 Tax=Litorimonas haliclonae TaxID=2081977 RepID=UPI0039EF9E95
MTKLINRRSLLAGASAALALPACLSSKKKMDADILVLGAGLAGLNTAKLLTEFGKDVLVLEAKRRAGGRLYTIEHENGYTEGGGEQVGAGYARILDLARQLNVGLLPESRTPRTTGYVHQGKWLSEEEFKSLSPFPESFKNSPPGAPLFQIAARENIFETADGWLTPPKGADESVNSILSKYGFSAGAKDIIDRALNGNDIETYSMLNVHRSLQLYTQSRQMGPSYSIEKGSQSLPEAMAKSLPRPIQYDSNISGIKVDEEAVEITLANGRIFRAAEAVCCLPFAALRRVNIVAPLSQVQNQAIKSLPYTQILQFHFKASSAFWEKDGLPVDMWSDTPLERIFSNLDPDGNPTGLFRCWINGKGTKHWANQDANSAKAAFLEKLGEIRPSTKGSIEDVKIVDWTKNNPLAGGSYMHWAPGQVEKWAQTMGAPAGRLHFAGEHLGVLHTGMEAAMESSENTALRVMNGS